MKGYKIVNKIESARILVESNAVKKYIIDDSERLVVVGNKKEYLVFDFPFWCGCESFSRKLFQNNKLCKHLLAVKIAKKENKLDEYVITKDEYDFIRDNFIVF